MIPLGDSGAVSGLVCGLSAVGQVGLPRSRRLPERLNRKYGSSPYFISGYSYMKDSVFKC